MSWHYVVCRSPLRECARVSEAHGHTGGTMRETTMHYISSFAEVPSAWVETSSRSMLAIFTAFLGEHTT